MNLLEIHSVHIKNETFKIDMIAVVEFNINLFIENWLLNISLF